MTAIGCGSPGRQLVRGVRRHRAGHQRLAGGGPRRRATRRVVLAGHSFGAIKALYYLAREHGPVDGLVLASPSLGLTRLQPDISNWPATWWAGAPVGTAAARQLARLRHGHGQRADLPQLGRGRRADLRSRRRRWPAGIRCPVLAFYGRGQDVGAEAELEFFTGRMSAAQVERRAVRRPGPQLRAAAKRRSRMPSVPGSTSASWAGTTDRNTDGRCSAPGHTPEVADEQQHGQAVGHARM